MNNPVDQPKVSELSPAAFFEWALVQQTKSCIVWPFAKNKGGYGYIRRGSVQGNAHRAICRLAHGEPPTSKHHAAHECGNRACINPNHLSWETPSENELDKRRHGTDLGGEKHPSSKLTKIEVLQLRAIGSSVSQAVLAKQFNISQTQVSSILRGTRWANL